MPDLPECIHSPFLNSNTLRGVALITGNARYCDLINPDHPNYNPGVARGYQMMSYLLMSADDPKDKKLKEKVKKIQDDIDRESIPISRNGVPREGPSSFDVEESPHHRKSSIGFKMLEDEQAHQQVYLSAINCPHRKQETSCCGPVYRCGPEGTHPGQVVGMGTCYPCSVGRLGIQAGPVDTIEGA